MTQADIGAPAVTVLMSCFNAERWLALAITSVLEQTLQDFEFIVIDDGSVDNTLAIIRRYAAIDSRIVVLSKPNSGLADSLNKGIMLARGDWIARIDADDVCESNRLEKQFERARLNNDLVFVGSDLTIIDEFGTGLARHHYPVDSAGLLRNLRTVRKFPAHSSAFYRKDVVQRLNGYRPRIRCAEDFDLWLRLADLGAIASVPESLVKVRKHDEQISLGEGGRRQLVDARVALVSYWLRQFKLPDPVDGDDHIFHSFRSWVELSLCADGFLDVIKHKNYLNRISRESRNQTDRFLKLIGACIVHPILTLRGIKLHFLGETLPLKLALAWKRQTKAA